MGATQATKGVAERPDWLPDEYELVQPARDELYAALDDQARRLFGQSAEEFLRGYRQPNGNSNNPVYRSLSHLADLIAGAPESTTGALAERSNAAGC